jgi:uncharacterized protein
MKIHQEIVFPTPPVMFAAWPGMGNVGLIAMDYFRRKRDAKLFAEIDMSSFFIPDSIVVKDGIAQFPELPSSIFSYTLDPSLIIFESNAQVSGRDGLTVTKTILDVAQRFNVSRIYTSAAFAQSMSYQSASQVLVASNSDSVLQDIGHLGIVPMPDGYIAGLNGLMLGVAKARGMEAACLLGTIPSYATNIAYPKASVQIIKVLSQIVNIKLNMAEIDEDVAEMDEQLATIEERIKQFFPANTEQDEEIAKMDQEKVPHYIMEKIEKLFQQAAEDHSLAPQLKEELDRWNLYELYENRFLDLFEDEQKGSKE